MLPECSLPALIGGTDPNGGSCAGGEDDVILTRWMGFFVLLARGDRALVLLSCDADPDRRASWD